MKGFFRIYKKIKEIEPVFHLEYRITKFRESL